MLFFSLSIKIVLNHTYVDTDVGSVFYKSSVIHNHVQWITWEDIIPMQVYE